MNIIDSKARNGYCQGCKCFCLMMEVRPLVWRCPECAVDHLYKRTEEGASREDRRRG